MGKFILTYTPDCFWFMNNVIDFEKMILVKITMLLQNQLDYIPSSIKIEKVKADNTDFAEQLTMINGYYRYVEDGKVKFWTGHKVFEWLNEKRFTYIIEVE